MENSMSIRVCISKGLRRRFWEVFGARCQIAFEKVQMSVLWGRFEGEADASWPVFRKKTKFSKQPNACSAGTLELNVLNQARHDLAAHQLNCAICSYPVVYHRYLEMPYVSGQFRPWSVWHSKFLDRSPIQGLLCRWLTWKFLSWYPW